VANPSGNLLAGRYRVLRRLGSGGMATVLLAEDERLGRQVAIKRMHAESAAEVAKRFRREAKLGASLNHPNVVSIFDIETDDEDLLIVMEHVPGGTLKDALARGRLPVDKALAVLTDIAAALDHAHQNGIVHRDVKPANVLLDADGRAKLADLGIATAAEVTHITQTGTVLGTAAYMAPERLEGHAGGPEADVYAFAALAYEALTRRKAREGRSALEIAHAVMGEPPPDLRTYLPGAPDRAADVLAAGMAREPAERPASAGALVRELSDAFERGPTAATAALPPRRPDPLVRRTAPVDSGDRSRWLAPALAVLALLAAAGVVLALAGGDDGSTKASTSSTSDPRAQATTTETRQQPTKPPAQKPPPEATVKAFYTSAAADEFDKAYALLGPAAQAQLGGYDGMVGALQSLESIEFPKLTATRIGDNSATVEFDSVAKHPDHVDRCTGTAELTASDDGWLIEHFNVNPCDTQPRGGMPPSATPGKGPAGGKPKKQKDKDRGGWRGQSDGNQDEGDD
jgi:serine/threonine protein kinase